MTFRNQSSAPIATVTAIAALALMVLCCQGPAQDKPGRASKAPPATSAAASVPTKLEAILRPTTPFYDVAGPLLLAIRLNNPTGAPFSTGQGMSLDDGIVVKDRAGNVLQKTGVLESEGKKLPPILDPNRVFDRTVDLRQGYPQLATPGCYTLAWNDPRVASAECALRVAPKYEKDKDYAATIETSQGSIVVEFYKDKAPNHVSNFVQLSRCGFYDGLTFHRVIDGYVIQGGDPRGDGTGGAGYKVRLEASDLKHEKGSLAMARGNDNDSASSQFYICLAPQPSLDGKYTVFGHVVGGMDVVEKIGKEPTSGPPNDRPVSPVTINKVTVSEKSATP